MKSRTHRSSTERDMLLRCDIWLMTCMKNDPTGGGNRSGEEEVEGQDNKSDGEEEEKRKYVE